MSKKRVMVDLSNNQYKNIIYKRLLCVAIYDYIENFTPITNENIYVIKNVLRTIIQDESYNFDSIILWLLDNKNKPLLYEKALMFNQMKAPAVLIRKKCKCNNSNISLGTNQTIITNTLSNDILITLLKGLMGLSSGTHYDFTIFKRIKWEV